MDITTGEFFAIVGPSGCGKTTLLRIIAGFETPTTGQAFLDGNDITHIPPQDRNIGMVFQNYALFPHMTAFRNIAFGLETRKLPRSEIEARVERMLGTVRLAQRRDLPVPMLSGGEQQRVAVGRAMVIEPAVLLFDEPLSNLDVTLRVRTREEIRSLQRAAGITTVYVTHDQAEAMSLADRIAVMHEGRIEQVGTPTQVYESPETPFVAAFLGSANMLNGVLEAGSGTFRSGELRLHLPAEARRTNSGPVCLAIKPEALTIVSGNGVGTGRIAEREYLGFTTNYTLSVNGVLLRGSGVSTPRLRSLAVGDTVEFMIDWSQCRLFRGHGVA